MLVTYGILPHPVARPDRDHHGEIADTVRLARAANRADQSLQRFGFVTFFAPISVLLFVPTLAGIAAAIALHNEARLPLPNPPRARVARAAWLLTWTTLACGAVNLGQLSVARLPAQPAALLLWAVMMEDHTTLGQWIGVAAISALVWSHYVLRAPRDM